MRRGQVTLFVIVGTVILLILVVTTFLFVSRSPSLPTIVESGSTELPPVQAFVERCLSATTQEGLVLAGMQGGYTQVPDRLKANPYLHVAVPRNNPVVLPLWNYQGNNYAPSTEEVQNQVAQFVNDNVQECLGSFTAFPNLDIESISDPVASIVFGENGVVAELNYNLKLQGGIGTGSQERFAVRLPINMLEILETAKTIQQGHSDDPFLASAALDLIALDAQNIPLAGFGVDFSCSQKLWLVNNVEDRFKELLYYNLPRIRFQGTDHRPFAEDPEAYIPYTQITIDNYQDVPLQLRENPPEDIYEFNHYYWYVGADVSSNVNAGVRYLQEFPLYMDIRPQDDGKLTASSALGNAEFLRYLCVEAYKFTYDVEFPVEIAIVNTDAFANGQSYVFRYALPVVIDNNIPTTQPLQRDYGSIFSNEKEFCQTRGDAQVEIIVVDEHTYEEIPDVDIYFDCLGLTCQLGTTQRADNGAASSLVTTVPEGCYGPLIRARGDSVTDGAVQWNNDNDNIYIETQRKMSVPLRVVLSPNDGLERSLEPGHEIFVNLVTEQGFDSIAVSRAGEYTTIEMLTKPQQYNVTAMLYYEGELAGGFTGTLEGSIDNYADTLVLHVWEDLSPPQNDEQIIDFFTEIQDPETYEGRYAPVWR